MCYCMGNDKNMSVRRLSNDAGIGTLEIKASVLVLSACHGSKAALFCVKKCFELQVFFATVHGADGGG